MALTFWYEFSSTYSYLAAMRIEDAAQAAGIEIEWIPFLLGPIFAAAGYAGSPNLVSAAKAQYMWTDLARRSEHRGHPFARPETFPQKSVTAARAAIALGADQRPAFSRAVYGEAFGKGRDIGDPQVVADAARAAGLDPDATLASAQDPNVKQALFDAVERAQSLGIFGAPSFVTSDGTLFWGDDRLEDALAWERTGKLA